MTRFVARPLLQRTTLRLLRRALCFALLPAALQAASGASLRFERIEVFSRTDRALAISAGPLGREVVIGDARGATSSVAGALPRRIATGAAVRDIRFDAAGHLWLATDDGLLQRVDGVLQSRGPGPGAARRTRRLLPLPGALLVASDDGLHRVGADGARSLDGRVPAGAVSALAWSPPALLVVLLDGDLYELRLGARHTVESARRVQVDDRLGAAVDLAAAAGRVFLLCERGIAARGPDGWRSRPLGLPPGAEAHRLAVTAGRFWVATEQGLLVAVAADATATRFERVPGVLGNSEIFALRAAADALFVVGAPGAFKLLRPDATVSSDDRYQLDNKSEHLTVERLNELPSIAAVHSAVMRVHSLDPKRFRHWRRRVQQRARWPTLNLRGAYGGDRDRGELFDETVTIVQDNLRALHDRNRDHGRDFDVSLTLSWDFGDLIAHPEEVDVAKEIREWIELRDEVLDEVDQLYFERLRVLQERAALEATDPKAALLEIRARELSAGIDAWTAGWWSRALATAGRQR